MAGFEQALNYTMKFEDATRSGVVSDEPNGAKARFGINSHAHPEMPDEFWTCDADLAFTMAAKVYKSDYWNPLRLESFDSQEIANKVFDMGVNMGTKTAAMCLQHTLNLFRPASQALAVEGAIGPLTLATVNSIGQTGSAGLGVLHHELDRMSAERYIHLAEANPKEYARWQKSWAKRAQA